MIVGRNKVDPKWEGRRAATFSQGTMLEGRTGTIALRGWKVVYFPSIGSELSLDDSIDLYRALPVGERVTLTQD